MTSHVGHNTNQPFGMHLRHVHVPASSPCLPPLSGPSFLNPKEESDFDLGLHEIVPFVPCTLQLYLPYTNFSQYNLLEVLMPLFHLQLDVVHFMWDSSPLKERWCPHHTLRLFFFADPVWNSSMASWACSMSDSFTQEASIRWYPFHLTRYSRSHPLSCLDLSTASTSNSGSLWTKFGGGLEVCSRLGLEASRATGFKKETWNVGWTLRFSDSSNL
jgi:hypothetical protein